MLALIFDLGECRSRYCLRNITSYERGGRQPADSVHLCGGKAFRRIAHLICGYAECQIEIVPLCKCLLCRDLFTEHKVYLAFCVFLKLKKAHPAVDCLIVTIFGKPFEYELFKRSFGIYKLVP